MLQEDEQNEEIIARVAALDIGKAELVCCVRIPHEGRPGRLCWCLCRVIPLQLTFFAQAPAMHPDSSLVKGVVCGVRVEEVQDPLMRKIRILDKLIDELAKGKALEKILRLK